MNGPSIVKRVRIPMALLVFAIGAAAAPAPEQPFDVPAEVLARRDVSVPAEVPGRVVQRPDDETAAVREGEIVVALDDVFLDAVARAARAAAERAKARSEWAKLEHDRVARLFERQSINKSELDRAQLAAREAAASLAAAAATALEAERRLERAKIRAPFDGKLVRIYPESGEYLRTGATAFRIVDDTALRLVAYVSADLVARLEVGQELLVVPERPDKHLPAFRAKLFSIPPAAEGKARTFRVEARAPRPAGRWRPGMTARLRPLPRAPTATPPKGQDRSGAGSGPGGTTPDGTKREGTKREGTKRDHG